MKSILALLAVLLSHYGYEWAAVLGDSTAKESSYWFYSFRGIEGAVLCWLLLPVFQSMNGWQKTVGVFAVLLGIFEESQTAICGSIGMGLKVPFGSTLCIETFGAMPYLAFTALAITYMLKGITKNEKH